MAVVEALLKDIERIEPVRVFGRVRAVRGLSIEIAGPVDQMRVGSRLEIGASPEPDIPCEIVGFSGNRALAMPFSALEGVRLEARTTFSSTKGGAAGVRPNSAWLGRVVNAMGQPIDGKGPLPQGPQLYRFRASPPAAHQRGRVGAPLDLGVRALNTFTTCCRGQRLGIFAGSGVGKSVLFSMLAVNTASDVAVIGLIGERGREVQEFITDDLGEAGLARSVVVVATADEAALMRRQAAFLTLALAEYFRDEGNDVLCLMDSVTRFALAQREIGLACGEPPTTRGYTPTVFTELPKLLERAGPGTGAGTITGLFTVLIEGDDHNEPVADAVRAVLDGHVVMDRKIADQGRFPAIDVLRSISRTMPACVKTEHLETLKQVRVLMGAYADMEEIIRLGAYRRGTDPLIDRAIALHPHFEEFLSQNKGDATTIDEGYVRLAQILNSEPELASQPAET
ncbi:MAG: flagellar protein export ATPase FliI [Alphaproteobacteria bacterium]